MVPLHIAIDGPVGSGKTYIAGEVAKRLGITYIYTGAMYRALAFVCVKENVPFKDSVHVLPLLEKYSIDVRPAREKGLRSFTVFLNTEDVTEKLFNPVIDQGTSDVSTIPEVRTFMVKKQQEMANGKSVVMEGRDIGLRVLPDAQLKIYLTASVEERSKRRLEQFRQKGIEKTLEEVIRDTKIRDEQDMTRQADPLQKLPDAWEFDTTGLSAEEVIQGIISELQKRKLV